MSTEPQSVFRPVPDHADPADPQLHPTTGVGMPTYAAPGVYVEEVASTQKVLSAAPTAVAAFVGFTERYPTDDPTDPDGLAPRLVTSWAPVREPVRRLHARRGAAAVGVRLLRQRRITGLHRPGAEHGAVRRAVPPRTARRRPRPRPADRRREPRAGRRYHHPGEHRGDRRGRAEPVLHRCAVRAHRRRVVPRSDPGQGQAQRRHRDQRDVDQDQGQRAAG